MNRRTRLALCPLLAALVCGGAAYVTGQVGHQSNADDFDAVKGPPSKIALNHGGKQAGKSIQKWHKVNDDRQKQYEEQAAQTHQQNNMQVASSRYGQTITRHPPGTITQRNGRKKPILVKLPETVIVKTNYQNTTLSFVDPRQQAVAGLRVIATVHRKTPRPGQEEDIVIGNAPKSPLSSRT